MFFSALKNQILGQLRPTYDLHDQGNIILHAAISKNFHYGDWYYLNQIVKPIPKYKRDGYEDLQTKERKKGLR